MVSDTVVVESRSVSASDAVPHRWASDGSGVYTIASVGEDSGGVSRGSKIVMNLKKSCHEFLEAKRIKDIIKRYSSFVPFPIKLNGEVVNTVSAVWTMDKSEVTEAQYKEFYKFISQAYDDPMFTLHFRTDAPLDLKVLFFTPSVSLSMITLFFPPIPS
jgi:HSP90 family molecular chaperone